MGRTISVTVSLSDLDKAIKTAEAVEKDDQWGAFCGALVEQPSALIEENHTRVLQRPRRLRLPKTEPR